MEQEKSENTTVKSPLKFSFGAFVLFIIITGAAAALRFIFLDKSMWVDEATTYVIASQKNLHALIALTSAKFTAHPPLYYILVFYWFKLCGGPALIAMRQLSAIIGVLWVMASYPMALELFRRRAAAFTVMALTALSPFAVYISQIARMYPLLTLLTVISCWIFLKLTSAGRRAWHWPAWVLTSVAMMYTHYYGANVIAFQMVLVYLWRQRLGRAFLVKWGAALLVVAAGFYPWLGAFMEQSKYVSHLMNALFPGPLDNLQFLIVLVGSGMSFSGVPVDTLTIEQFTALFVYGCFTLIICTIWALLLRRGNRPQFQFIAAFLGIPIVLMFVGSAFVKGIVFQWHFSYLAPAAFLLAAFALCFGRSWIMKGLVGIICIVLFSVGLQAQYRARFWDQDWRGIANHILTNSKGPQLLISMSPLNDYPLKDFYLSGKPVTVESLFSSIASSEFGESPMVALADAAYRNDCVWLLMTEPAMKKELDPMWLYQHFSGSLKKTFPTVFTQLPLSVERLCLNKDDFSLRRLAPEHFRAFITSAWNTRDRTQFHLMRANFYIEYGYFTLAEEEIAQASSENIRLTDSRVKLGVIFRKQGRNGSAIKQWIAAEAERPDDSQIKLFIGETYYSAGRPAEAAFILNKIKDDKDYGKYATEILDKINKNQ